MHEVKIFPNDDDFKIGKKIDDGFKMSFVVGYTDVF